LSKIEINKWRYAKQKKWLPCKDMPWVIGRSDGAFVSLCLLFSTISWPLTGLFGQGRGSEAPLSATCL
jgi:hypothetical protein